MTAQFDTLTDGDLAALYDAAALGEDLTGRGWELVIGPGERLDRAWPAESVMVRRSFGHRGATALAMDQAVDLADGGRLPRDVAVLAPLDAVAEGSGEQTGETSQNGWPVHRTSAGLRRLPWITGRVLPGDVWTIFDYLCRRFDGEVEAIDPRSSWGWAYRPIRGRTSGFSNHASGTAIDLNAPRHPLGARGTFTAAQRAQIRSIISDLDRSVRWGGDYRGRADEMHFEINDSPQMVGRVAGRVAQTSAGVTGPTAGALKTPLSWGTVGLDERRVYVMRRLIAAGYPVNGAAGIVGNLESESGLIPNRIEGSTSTAPMRARDFSGTVRTFTADAIMNRDPHTHRGPRRPGVGLAQWTSPARRAGLFRHTYGGLMLGARILFDMDAQLDYLVQELRTSYRRVDALLRDPGVTVDAAADEVVYNFEVPGAILANRRKRPRTDPQVQRVFSARRRAAHAALAAYRRAGSSGAKAVNILPPAPAGETDRELPAAEFLEQCEENGIFDDGYASYDTCTGPYEEVYRESDPAYDNAESEFDQTEMVDELEPAELTDELTQPHRRFTEFEDELDDAEFQDELEEAQFEGEFEQPESEAPYDGEADEFAATGVNMGSGVLDFSDSLEAELFSFGDRYALLAAMARGERSANELTDAVFYRRHPERGGRPIERTEPGADRLIAEWLEIRRMVVAPFLARMAGGAKPSTTTPPAPRYPAGRQRMRTQAVRNAWARYARREGLMVRVDILGHRTRVNPLIRDAAQALGQALATAGYQATWVGGFSDRKIRGSESLSLHAYGLAIDIDAKQNPRRRGQRGPARFSNGDTQAARSADVRSNRADTTFTPRQIEAARSVRTVHGHPVFYWAGGWRWEPDAMHFQVDVTPAELAVGLSPSTITVR